MVSLDRLAFHIDHIDHIMTIAEHYSSSFRPAAQPLRTHDFRDHFFAV